MRVPSFERFQRFSALGACFVCGMVVGAAVWTGLASESYNQVILENMELTQQIENYKEDIEQLKNNPSRESIIKSIIVFVEEKDPPIDVVTEQELKKRVKQDLNGFRGRRVYDIGQDAPFARTMLQNKIYAIRDSEYTVRITTMLVADGVLQVWVAADLYMRP